MSLPAGFSSLIGYMLYSDTVDLRALIMLSGTLCLISAACALNQVQEADTDRLMPRTRQRPVPSGRIKPYKAIIASAIAALAGFIILYAESPISANLGLLAILVYNLLYTRLKRVSPYCIFIGSIAGAIPPVIGWTYAGGSFFEPVSIYLFIFFYIWQIPHFILILSVYKNEYRDAGFPVFSDRFNNRQLVSITAIWMLSFTCAGLMLFDKATGSGELSALAITLLILSASFIGPILKLNSKKHKYSSTRSAPIENRSQRS